MIIAPLDTAEAAVERTMLATLRAEAIEGAVLGDGFGAH